MSERSFETNRLPAERLDRLSAREREILDLGVEGRSDSEIAQSLGISVSTVNSYWTRIRGKLGSLSRTELAGIVFRSRVDDELAGLIEENLRLAKAERIARAESEGLRRELAMLQGGGSHALALDHAPDSILVCGEPSTITFANQAAHRLFGAEPGSLAGRSLHALASEAHAESIERLFGNVEERAEIGLDTTFRCLRYDGATFPAVVTAERCSHQTWVVTIRDRRQELEAVVRSLRLALEE